MSGLSDAPVQPRDLTPPSVRSIVAACLRSVDEARAIESEWRELADRATGITPFQYPAWLFPWYDVWAPDRVRIFIARDEAGRLLAVVPTVIAESGLELAGSGVGDYLAPLLDPAAVDVVTPVLDAMLSEVGRPVAFHDVPPDSPWAVAIRANSTWTSHAASVCPIAPLAPTISAWRAQLPSGLRRNIRRYWDHLREDASARFETVAVEQDLPAALDTLIALHAKEWHERGHPGVLQNEQVQRFHRSAAPRLLRSGLLRLHLLIAGDAAIAAQLVLLRPPYAYTYVGGFDPEWRMYGPGTLLMAHSIEQSIVDGCTAFDFLRGREPYKYRWGAVDRCSVSLLRHAGGS
jgi:CelD/BcsL family acetyltransferase involved in cellulose biosynthesis